MANFFIRTSDNTELSLREKEALIEQGRFDMIATSYGNMTVNELFDFYVKMKQKRGKSLSVP